MRGVVLGLALVLGCTQSAPVLAPVPQDAGADSPHVAPSADAGTHNTCQPEALTTCFLLELRNPLGPQNLRQFPMSCDMPESADCRVYSIDVNDPTTWALCCPVSP